MRLFVSIFEGLNWKKYISIALILGIHLPIMGQKMYFSNVPRLNSKAYYNKVIGENAGGIYILRFRDIDLRGGFSIERYSHNLDFLESENYRFSKKERLIKIYTCDSGMILIKKSWDKNGTKFSAVRAGFGLQEFSPAVELYTSNRPEKSEDDVKADYSSNRNFGAIWISELTEENNQKYTHLIFNSQLQIQHKKTFSIAYPHKNFEIQQTAVSNLGETSAVFELKREDKKATDPTTEEHFIVNAGKGYCTDFITLADYKYFLANYELVFNELNGTFNLAGYYDFKKPGAEHGLALFRYFPGDSAIHGKLQPFDRKFVAQLIGAKDEQAGEEASHFFVRKIISRDDGGMLLVGEYFEITQQMETFYLNGVPQVSSKNLYHYDDIMFVSVDSSGEIEWHYILNKRQSSYAGLAYLQSFGLYICEKSVNIVFNDNSGQNNRVMHVKLSSNGIMEQRILLNSENEYSAVIPVEGKQTGYNRYVTPIIQNRQMTLLQLVEDLNGKE